MLGGFLVNRGVVLLGKMVQTVLPNFARIETQPAFPRAQTDERNDRPTNEEGNERAAILIVGTLLVQQLGYNGANTGVCDHQERGSLEMIHGHDIAPCPC